MDANIATMKRNFEYMHPNAIIAKIEVDGPDVCIYTKQVWMNGMGKLVPNDDLLRCWRYDRATQRMNEDRVMDPDHPGWEDFQQG